MYHLKCWRISHSVVFNSVTLWTVAHKAPLSMGYSRQEYWSGLPFPSPGYLLNPVIEPGSPHCRHSLLSYVHIIMHKHHHHPSPDLILWNWNAIPFKQWHSHFPSPRPCNYHPTFCLYEISLLKVSHLNGIIQYFFFVTGLYQVAQCP